MSRYIEFIHIEDKPKTSVWSCRNIKSGDELGQILWYAPWRQYCYVPVTQGVYNKDCLESIVDFIEKQMKARG